MTNHNLLKSLVRQGAQRKGLRISRAVSGRINSELTLIEKMGFTDFLLRWARIVEVCNDLKLLRSYGRNTSANSLICYCLDIAKINPLDENLIFEVFLHPQRRRPPIVDVDIPLGYQNAVVELLRKKYPQYHVYFIAFSPKNGLDCKELIYNGLVCKKHPYGILLTAEALQEHVFSFEGQDYYYIHDRAHDPLFGQKHNLIEQKYLYKLQQISEQVDEAHHPYHLPLHDKAAFDLLASNNLEDIFFFNDPVLAEVLSQLKPDSVYDLAMIHALPFTDMKHYLPHISGNKAGGGRPRCSDAVVNQILSETHDLLIYQDTFIRLAREVAGMSLHRAMFWLQLMVRPHDDETREAFRLAFGCGCREQSKLNDDEIEQLADHVQETIPRLFPRAHALSYAIISYWGAYYKTHFPAEFRAAFGQTAK